MINRQDASENSYKIIFDKVAVITGARRGIAIHCAQKDMKFVLADIQLDS